MKNKELQELLKQFPDDWTVWIDVSIQVDTPHSTTYCQHMLTPTSVQQKHGAGFSTVHVKSEHR